MFDPCGTRHADGEELIKRLAKHLNVTPVELEKALVALIASQTTICANDGGCGCGD